MHLETRIKQIWRYIWRCIWSPGSSNWEIHLEAEIVPVSRCIWRWIWSPRSSNSAMQLVAVTKLNSEMHSECVMGRILRCIWRPRTSYSKIHLDFEAQNKLRSCYGGCGKDKFQTMISTGVRISPTVRHAPFATHHHWPPAAHLVVPGSCNSTSLWIKHQAAYIEAYSETRSGVSGLLKVYLGA